jgi:hypothetical protein
MMNKEEIDECAKFHAGVSSRESVLKEIIIVFILSVIIVATIGIAVIDFITPSKEYVGETVTIEGIEFKVIQHMGVELTLLSSSGVSMVLHQRTFLDYYEEGSHD